MASRADLNQRIADARRQLMNLSGVIGVGYGYKEERGEATKKLSLRVYVREKKPSETLDPRDVVPKEINGLRTDVVLPIRVRPAQCRDTEHHGAMIGGIRITNLRQYLADPGEVEPTVGSGTLGCICTLNDVGGRDNVGFFTCNHVLGDAGGANGNTVYQPDIGGERPPNRFPIGRIHNVGHRGEHHFAYPEDREAEALDYYIDCATAKINTKFSSFCDTNCGVKFDTRIRSLDLGGSSAVAGFQRLGPDDVVEGEDYLLYKVGASTGLTIGHVRDVIGTVEDPHTGEMHRHVLVMQYHGPNCGGALRTATGGDSGSAVLNEDRMVVGILHATEDILEVNAIIGHIHPIMDRLNATVRSTGSGPAAAGGGTLSVRGGVVLPPTPTRERAAALRERILFSRKGKDLYRLVDRHREEVLHLVNHARPVTVAWHRNRGPDFLAHAGEAARDTLYRVPGEVQGVERGAALERVLDALERHGSADLRRDIEEQRHYLDYLAREVDDVEQLAKLLLPVPSAKAG
jgi:hypothetical protein